MLRSYKRGDGIALAALALLPLVAHASALLDHRLLGPGDGVAMHLPLRVEAWEQWRSFSLPLWNTQFFLGTPLLGAYRGGVMYPLTILLSPFDPFSSFQALVLISIAFAGIVTYLYLKRLGCAAPGAFVGALSFAHGPYLLGHLEDTAMLSASALLPLVLLTAESHMNRTSPGRIAGLGTSIGLLVLAGSPEALRAGAVLLFGRLLIGYYFQRTARTPPICLTALAILIGLGLSAPQWLATLELLPNAGRQTTGLAALARPEGASGLAGLILRYVSHTPSAALAIASLPLLAGSFPVRVLFLAATLALGLQVGRGPLLSPGSLPLVVDFALAVLGGLALDAQWKTRGTRGGRRLRAYFLIASLAAVAALAIAAATLGPLPERLAPAVGLYAISLVLYFTFSQSTSPVIAGAFLLPLAVSFAFQPWSRNVWFGAPTRSELVRGTATRHGVDLALSQISPRTRVVTLVTAWPDNAIDIGFAGFGALASRVQANGYDPLAPLPARRLLGEMGARGTFAPGSALPSIEKLRAAAIDAVLVRSQDLGGKTEGGNELRLGPNARAVVPIAPQEVRVVRVNRVAAPGTLRVEVRTLSDRWIEAPQSGSDTFTLPAKYVADSISLRNAAAPLVVTSVRFGDESLSTASRLSLHLASASLVEIPATPTVRVFRVPYPTPRSPETPVRKRPRTLGFGLVVAAATFIATLALLRRTKIGSASFVSSAE